MPNSIFPTDMPVAALTHPTTSDLPISQRDKDLLHRRGFAERVAFNLAQRRGDESLVIGLFGPWGNGKSSIKNMIVEALNDQEILRDAKPPYVIDFNPWQTQDVAQLTGLFFREIELVLRPKAEDSGDDKEKAEERAKKWAAYGSLINVASSTTSAAAMVAPLFGPLGVFAAPLIKATSDALEKAGGAVDIGQKALEAQAEIQDKKLEDLRDELRRSLLELDRPILVVIDDIDRLSAPEIATIFSLVKANGNFPNLIYLLLCQRDIVEASLEKVAPGSGRDFLKKIVQVDFNVPEIERRDMEAVLFEGINNRLDKYGVKSSLDMLLFNRIYDSGMNKFFQTLRDVYRFLGTLDFHVGMFVESGRNLGVNLADLMALETLRLFEPEIYEAIRDQRALFIEYSAEDQTKMSMRLEEEKRLYDKRRNVTLTSLEYMREMELLRDLLKSDAQKTMDTLLERCSASRSQVKGLLSVLFPMAARLLGAPDSKDTPLDRRRQARLCSPEYFDRYFLFRVPSTQVSDASLQEFFLQVGDTEAVQARLQKEKDEGTLADFLGRIVALARTRVSPAQAQGFVTALLDFSDEIPREAWNALIGAPLQALLSEIISQVLSQIGEQKGSTDLANCYREAMRSTVALTLPCLFVGEAARVHPIFNMSSSNQERLQQWQEALRALGNEPYNEWLARIQAAATDGRLARQNTLLPLLRLWRAGLRKGQAQETEEDNLDAEDPSSTSGLGKKVTDDEPSRWLTTFVQDPQNLARVIEEMMLIGETTAINRLGETAQLPQIWQLATLDDFVPLADLQQQARQLVANRGELGRLSPNRQEIVKGFVRASERPFPVPGGYRLMDWLMEVPPET